MKYTISFTAWYLNPSRICQLLQRDAIETLPNSNRFGLSVQGRELAGLKADFEVWLRANPLRSLGEILVRGEDVAPGTLFSIHHDFYGKGLARYARSVLDVPRDALAELNTKLDYGEPRSLRIEYSPHYFTSMTAWSRFERHPRLYCIAYVERTEANGLIVAHPYMIGDPNSGSFETSPDAWNGRYYGEVHFSRIQQFAAVRPLLATMPTPNVEQLRSIPEIQIKRAFAEILNEGRIPKDWAGESSDLQSNAVVLDGEGTSAAFLLKGPAKFEEMKPKHLGLQGDQIVRLFDEPHQLLVLQHCHHVSSAVRKQMRAFAERFSDPRYFAIIDGQDTIRLLTAYGKCGFGTSN